MDEEHDCENCKYCDQKIDTEPCLSCWQEHDKPCYWRWEAKKNEID